jgi:hypothetical protein
MLLALLYSRGREGIISENFPIRPPSIGWWPISGMATSPSNFLERRLWTTSQRISDQFLDAHDAGTGGGVVSCSGMAPQVRIAWRELHRPLRIGNPNA